MKAPNARFYTTALLRAVVFCRQEHELSSTFQSGFQGKDQFLSFHFTLSGRQFGSEPFLVYYGTDSTHNISFKIVLPISALSFSFTHSYNVLAKKKKSGYFIPIQSNN